jgi:hypothetical protein
MIGEKAPLRKKSTSMAGGSFVSTVDGWLAFLVMLPRDAKRFASQW